MDIKTLEQALKLQNDLATRLKQNLVSGSTGKAPAVEVLLKEKEQLVVRAQAEVEAAIKERDVAVSRWDERVAQRKASLAKLESEFNDLRELLARQKKQPRGRETGNAKKGTRTPKKR